MTLAEMISYHRNNPALWPLCLFEWQMGLRADDIASYAHPPSARERYKHVEVWERVQQTMLDDKVLSG